MELRALKEKFGVNLKHDSHGGGQEEERIRRKLSNKVEETVIERLLKGKKEEEKLINEKEEQLKLDSQKKFQEEIINKNEALKKELEEKIKSINDQMNKLTTTDDTDNSKEKNEVAEDGTMKMKKTDVDKMVNEKLAKALKLLMSKYKI